VPPGAKKEKKRRPAFPSTTRGWCKCYVRLSFASARIVLPRGTHLALSQLKNGTVGPGSRELDLEVACSSIISQISS
jgi:hypothetical protein